MNTVKQLLDRLKTDYEFRTFIIASGALAVTVAFAFYNGFLGIYLSSLWHGVICVYYIVLVYLRGTVLIAAKKIHLRGDEEQDSAKNKVYLAVSGLFLLLNICLVVPVMMMVKQQKPVNMSQFFSILLAAYTMYKIIIASVNFIRRKQSSNILTHLLRRISFIDALVSILVLQNTLIMVNTDGGDLKLLPLTAISSGVIWVVIVIVSIDAFIKGVRRVRNEEKASAEKTKK